MASLKSALSQIVLTITSRMLITMQWKTQFKNTLKYAQTIVRTEDENIICNVSESWKNASLEKNSKAKKINLKCNFENDLKFSDKKTYLKSLREIMTFYWLLKIK